MARADKNEFDGPGFKEPEHASNEAAVFAKADSTLKPPSSPPMGRVCRL